MIDFRLDHLGRILSTNPNVEEWYNAMIKLFPDYEIDTKERIAAFISQCQVESMNFTRLKENLNYRAESLVKQWPKYFPNMEIAQKYAHNQEAIANRAYANRMGNGDEESGDGWKYCGRGLIQLTGKNNYQLFADSLEMPVEDVPEYLLTFEGAVQSACFYWETNNCNQFADNEDLKGLTMAINGGVHGINMRIDGYYKAMEILNT